MMDRCGIRVGCEDLRRVGREKSFKKMRAKSKHFMRAVKKMVSQEKLVRAVAVAVTLTFRDNAEFLRCRSRRPRSGVSQYLRDVTQWVERRGGKVLAHAFVLELQERGVPHYHVLLILDRPMRMPKPDEWVWDYGMSNIFSLGSVERLSVSYLAKYLQKGDQKGWSDGVGCEYVINPDTGRKEKASRDLLYGVKKFSWVIRLEGWREVLRWLNLPDYLRGFSYYLGELPRRVSRAGWYFPENRYLIFTDGQFIMHKRKTVKRVSGHYFKYASALVSSPGGYAAFVYPSYVGVLEDVGWDEVAKVQAENDQMRRHWGGAWYPINAGVECVLFNDSAAMSRDEVFSLPIRWE